MLLNRRDFLKTTALAAATVSFPFPVRGRPRFDGFAPIRRGVGVFEGEGGTIGWLINDDALVVIDTQSPESATTFWTGIQERTDRSIELLINSHHHGDHTGGNSVLGPHANQILAHSNVPGLQRASAESRNNLESQVYADLLYDQAWERDAGDETIRLKYYGSAHTGGDSVIHFEKANVVHVGDLVFNRMPAYIDLPAGATTEGSIRVLEAIHDDFSDETVFIFGHGNPANGIIGTRADLILMRDFFTALREYVGKGIAEGKSAEELDADRLPGFESHYIDDWAGGINHDIQMVYSELSDDQNP